MTFTPWILFGRDEITQRYSNERSSRHHRQESKGRTKIGIKNQACQNKYTIEIDSLQYSEDTPTLRMSSGFQLDLHSQ